jgi:hypothetical protein
MNACTEKEAAEKWCPHARRDIDKGSNVVIAPGGQTFFPTCWGSRCMQWRWFDRPTVTFGTSPKIGEARRGYCGLAGLP